MKQIELRNLIANPKMPMTKQSIFAAYNPIKMSEEVL